MSVSPYYLALAGAIAVGVGAQVLLKRRSGRRERSGAVPACFDGRRFGALSCLGGPLRDRVAEDVDLDRISDRVVGLRPHRRDRLLRLQRADGAFANWRSHSNHGGRQPASSIHIKGWIILPGWNSCVVLEGG